ncbi:MAG: hypothetical protein AAFR31_19395 [Cyanobacteria bacterium J06627_8]
MMLTTPRLDVLFKAIVSSTTRMFLRATQRIQGDRHPESLADQYAFLLRG